MTRARIEFTVEPFVDGSPGPHVTAAVDAVESLALQPEIGPFGTSVEGSQSKIVEAVGALLHAAGDAGAARVSMQIDFLR